MVIEHFKKFQIKECMMIFLEADFETVLQPEKLCTSVDLGWKDITVL